jgi:hypothetical protein
LIPSKILVTHSDSCPSASIPRSSLNARSPMTSARVVSTRYIRGWTEKLTEGGTIVQLYHVDSSGIALHGIKSLLEFGYPSEQPRLYTAMAVRTFDATEGFMLVVCDRLPRALQIDSSKSPALFLYNRGGRRGQSLVHMSRANFMHKPVLFVHRQRAATVTCLC